MNYRPKAWDVGDLVRLTATLTNLEQVAADPDLIACRILLPSGSVVDLAPTKVDVGIYTADYVIQQSGLHYYRWTSTGNVDVSEEGQLLVRPRQVPDTPAVQPVPNVIGVAAERIVSGVIAPARTGYAGQTVGTSTAYTITIGGFQVVDGARLTVVFHASNSTDPTLSVNGGTAYPIKVSPLLAGTYTVAGMLPAGIPIDLVFGSGVWQASQTYSTIVSDQVTVMARSRLVSLSGGHLLEANEQWVSDEYDPALLGNSDSWIWRILSSASSAALGLFTQGFINDAWVNLGNFSVTAFTVVGLQYFGLPPFKFRFSLLNGAADQVFFAATIGLNEVREAPPASVDLGVSLVPANSIVYSDEFDASELGCVYHSTTWILPDQPIRVYREFQIGSDWVTDTASNAGIYTAGYCGAQNWVSAPYRFMRFGFYNPGVTDCNITFGKLCGRGCGY